MLDYFFGKLFREKMRKVVYIMMGKRGSGRRASASKKGTLFTLGAGENRREPRGQNGNAVTGENAAIYRGRSYGVNDRTRQHGTGSTFI